QPVLDSRFATGAVSMTLPGSSSGSTGTTTDTGSGSQNTTPGGTSGSSSNSSGSSTSTGTTGGSSTSTGSGSGTQSGSTGDTSQQGSGTSSTTSGQGTATSVAAQLQAVAADGHVQLSWLAVPGASSYRVYRSEGTSQPLLIGSTSGTSLVDNGGTAGSVYQYELVPDLPAGGQSVTATTASATWLAAASRPTIIEMSPEGTVLTG